MYGFSHPPFWPGTGSTSIVGCQPGLVPGRGTNGPAPRPPNPFLGSRQAAPRGLRGNLVAIVAEIERRTGGLGDHVLVAGSLVPTGARRCRRTDEHVNVEPVGCLRIDERDDRPIRQVVTW